MDRAVRFPDFVVLQGRGMSPGRAAGPLVRNGPALSPAAAAGRILVAQRAVPEDIERILASAGTITIAATLLSHVSLLSREFGKPSVSFSGGSAVRLVAEPGGGALLALDDWVGTRGMAHVPENEPVLLDGESGIVAIPRCSTETERAALRELQARLAEYARSPEDRIVRNALMAAIGRGGAAALPYLLEAALAFGGIPRGEPSRRLLDALERRRDLRATLHLRLEEIGHRVRGEIDDLCERTGDAVAQCSDPEELERILRRLEASLTARFALLDDLDMAGDSTEPGLEALLRAAEARRSELRANLDREIATVLNAGDDQIRSELGGWFRMLRRARAAHLDPERVNSLHRRLSRVLAEERRKTGTDLVVPLTAGGRVGRERIGGKAAGLAEIAGLLPPGCRVPPGFVVTSSSYRLHLLGETGERMRLAAAESLDRLELSRRARAAILSGPVPSEVAEAVSAAVAELGDGRLAVRSSATVEDGPAASLAGLFDTYLGVAGGDAVLERIRWAWASLWNARALAALDAGGLLPVRAAQAVLVQRMIATRTAGVFFTSDPAGHPDTMLVSACWGLGEGVSQGSVRGDAFWVRRSTGVVLATETGEASTRIVLDPAGPGTVEVPLAAQERGRPCLDESQLGRLAELARILEQGTGRAQDVEFGFDGEGVLHVFQIRRVVPARQT